MMLNNFIETWHRLKPKIFSSDTTLLFSLPVIFYFIVDTIYNLMW